MRTLADLLKEHAFFEDLDPDDLAFIAACSKNRVFQEGEVIARPGDLADTFYLIREGRVSMILEQQTRPAFVFQTVGVGEILGLSWLIPPYLWTAKAQASQLTRVIAFDGKCIREKCEKKRDLGFVLMKHLVSILLKREEAAMLHVLDVYGE